MKIPLILLSILLLAVFTAGLATGYPGDSTKAVPTGSKERPGRFHRSKRGQCALHERHQCREQGSRRQRMERKGDGLAARRLMRHAEDLKLTDEQMEKLGNLAYTSQLTIIDLRADIQKERLEVERRLHSDSEDLAKIKQSLNAIAKMRVDIHMARLTNWVESKKILTEEQKQLIKDRYPRLGRALID